MTTGYSTGILLRCDGSREIGLGHLARCSVLARTIAPERHRLVIRRDPVACRFLEERGLDYTLVPDSCPAEQEPAFLASLAADSDLPFVLLDRKDNPRQYVEELVAAGLLVVDFEDLGPGRDFAHLLVDSHIWAGANDSLYRGRALCGFGPDWAILDPSYAVTRLRQPAAENRLLNVVEIVVACGGSDPAGLAPLILEALDRIQDDFHITVVAGTGAAQADPACLYHEVRVLRGAGQLDSVLARAQLAVVSGGITMFEALCLGLPVLVVPQHREQYVNASRFALHSALSLVPPPGEPDHAERMYRALEQMLDDPVLRLGLARSGMTLVDGRGIERLSAVLGYLEATHRAEVLKR